MQQIKLTPPADQIVEVTDVGHMAIMVTAWQERILSMLRHMKDMPAGTEVTQDDGPVFLLVGDALAGYQLGISLAIEEMSTLPFQTITDKEPVSDVVTTDNYQL